MNEKQLDKPQEKIGVRTTNPTLLLKVVPLVTTCYFLLSIACCQIHFAIPHEIYTYTPPKNVWGGLFLTGNQGNHQNFNPSLFHKKL